MTRVAIASAVLVALLADASHIAAHAGRTQFPGRLDRFLADTVRLGARERQRLLRGEPVTKLLDADVTKEVAVFGAIWIAAPMHRYVQAVNDIETFERGPSFRVTKRISDPPGIQDFAQLRLPDRDIDDMKDCRVGDCILKLGEPGVRRFRAEIDWNSPRAHENANALMRQLALQYVTGYLDGGNERLAVYRDSARPTFVATEFREMIDQMPELTTYLPNMRRYLLEFPRANLPGATSFLYWQETDFGLRPTIRISHVVVREGPDDTVVAAKMLYASHYFWTGLELRTLVPDPARGPGFWFVTVSRSRSDGLSGFTGFFVRRRVRSAVQDGSMAALRSTKQRLEAMR